MHTCCLSAYIRKVACTCTCTCSNKKVVFFVAYDELDDEEDDEDEELDDDLLIE